MEKKDADTIYLVLAPSSSMSKLQTTRKTNDEHDVRVGRAMCMTSHGLPQLTHDTQLGLAYLDN